MLKTIPFDLVSDERLLEVCPDQKIEELRKIYNPIVLSEGIISSSLNFDHKISNNVICDTFSTIIIDNEKAIKSINFYNFEKPLEEYSKYSNNEEITMMDNYGVCDNVEQVIETFKLDNADFDFSITMTPIYKSQQCKNGGWRWHKWGKYIGEYEPKHEYLYDEDIEEVYIFHIYVFEIKEVSI